MLLTTQVRRLPCPRPAARAAAPEAAPPRGLRAHVEESLNTLHFAALAMQAGCGLRVARAACAGFQRSPRIRLQVSGRGGYQRTVRGGLPADYSAYLLVTDLCSPWPLTLGPCRGR